MKKNVLFILMMVIAMVAFAACSSDDSTTNPGVDGDDPSENDENEPGTDGDTDDPVVEDGDEPVEDGDEPVEDGDEADTPEETGGDLCYNHDDCSADEMCCLDTLSCGDFLNTCVTSICVTNTECTSDFVEWAGDDFDEFGWECDLDDELCYKMDCATSADCDAGYYCTGGVCKVAPVCDDIATVVIDQGARAMISGANPIQLTVTAYNANNARIPADVTASCTEWASDDETIVTVEAGLLTGGATAGTTDVTVTVTGGSISDAIEIQNIPVVGEGMTRVVAFDDKTQNMIDGANVAIVTADTRAVVEGVTSGGIAELEVDCSGGCDVHVFHADYTYVSALGLTSSDILLPLAPNVDDSIATGVKGYQDESPIPASVAEGMDVRLGLTAFSIPGNLADLNFEALLGEMLPTQVLTYEVELPAGIELYLSGESVKEEGWSGYMAAGVPGPGTLWGLGGYASLGEIIELVSGALGGDIDIGAILGAILPLFEGFYHANLAGFDLDSIPKVVDVNDINGNGETDDMVPDFDAWANVNKDLKLSQPQSAGATLQVGDLPAMSAADSGCADAVITLVGAMQTGVGFVPLGLNAAMDMLNNEDSPNCKVGENNDGNLSVVFAPQHDGVDGYEYFTLSLALSVGTLLGDVELKAEGDSPALQLSGVVTRTADQPTTVAQPDFIGFMETLSYDKTAGVLANANLSGADVHRVVFAKDFDGNVKKYWHVYYGASADGFTLPTSENFSFDIEDRGTGDISSMSMAQAMVLDGLSYDDLLSFNGQNVNNLNYLMKAFSISGL